MHAVLLAAAFCFTAALALAAAARRPLVAVLVLVIGAAWPATLLPDERDLTRGAVILGAALLLLAGLRRGGQPSLGRAALAGTVVLGAAVVAVTQPAVAKSEFLHWQSWDPYTRPTTPVGVRYVWNASYDGFSWPLKRTTVLRVKASSRSLYWRATTLDLFTGARWVENLAPAREQLFDGRLDLTQDDPLSTAAARRPERWHRVEVEVEALADNHLVAPSVPVAYAPTFGGVTFAQGGIALLPRGLRRGERYPAWSYSPQPSAAELSSVKAAYPAAILPYLELKPGLNPPPAFGTPGRTATMKRFLDVYPDYRAVYEQARRVVGRADGPYAAVLAIESWLRSTGGFTYTTHPPQSSGAPLRDFLLTTKRGYCQHFAGAMTLMLRYLGIPARVAAGFVSGTYDSEAGMWTVTDHDAHAWVEVWFPRYGWLPFDPTPGRGYLSADYSVSSPQFKAASAARLIGGVAALLLNTAALHQDVGFGEKDPGVTFAGTDIRRANPNPGRVFGLQHRGGSLGKLLGLVLAGTIALLAAVKAVRRHLRYATPDPRRQAAACRDDLRDFLADQGIVLPASAAPGELAALLRSALEVDAEPFAAALAEARFGPPEEAATAVARARTELARLRDQIRNRLGPARRARGLVSLRSLGFAA
jgi:transglutaminase-like putative cysteine protease